MGNHINGFVCIDFFGLPGCGKSTLSHLVSEKLRAAGLFVKEISYDMDHGKGSLLRTLKKSFATIKLFFFHPCLSWRVSKILSAYGISLFSKNYFKQIINLSYKICALKGQTDIIMFDEGLCQAVLSLSVNNDGMREDCYNSLIGSFTNDRKMINIYVKTEPEIALSRIRKRNDKQSRLDYLSNEKAIVIMRKMETLCGALPKTIVVENNNNEDFKKLVDHIASIASKEIIT